MRRSDSAEPGFKRCAVSVLVGSLAGYAGCLVLLLPVTAAILSGLLDEGLAGVLLVAAVFIGAAIGSVFTARKAKARMIPLGAIAGLTMFLWLFITGLFLSERFAPTENGIGLLLAAIAGGLLGGRIASSGRGSSGIRRSKRK